MPTIFVSHASKDRHLALMIKELLIAALERTTPKLRVFCSSDVGDIEGGKKWFDQIMGHLRDSAACVALMTPGSVYFSPWVTYEAGGAYLQFEIDPMRSRLFPVCAYGMRAGILPSPFNELQVRNLANHEEVLTLIAELTKCLKSRSSKKPRSFINELVAEASKGSSFWGYVSAALVGERQGSSPLNFECLVKDAKKEIFCAGFNLEYLARTAHIKEELFNFLAVEPSRSVRILISNPKKHRDFAAWKLIGASYLDDLKKSVSHFESWLREARKRRLRGNLEIKMTNFIALTVGCIDPDSSEAQMVLTPVIIGKPLSADRPHFWLARSRQAAAFSYYWDTYQDLFRRGTPITV